MSHQIVSEEQWISARKQLLLKEKELTRMQDEVNQLRRELPWVRVEKQYVFDKPNGKQSLAQLFDGRSQLIVCHFMFAPGRQDASALPSLPTMSTARTFISPTTM
jgi:predicted dithiol-disulfide oxidoreductase (DUF899 family)